MINTDILSRGALFAGPHGRPHGDWLGATVEFDVREGSRDRAGMRAAVSGTSAAGVFEGPIGRAHRGSWLFSIRKSYIDWLIRKIDPEADSTIGFSDAQTKFTYDITARQQIQFFGIAGDATFRDTDVGLANGIDNARSRSAMGSLSWRLVHRRAVVSQRLSFISARYENRGQVGQHLADGTNSAVLWRADVTAPLSRGWTLEGGVRHESTDATETLRNFAATGPSSVRLRFERVTTADPSTVSGWMQASWRNARGGIAGGFRVSDRSTGEHAALPWLLAERTWGTTTFRAGAGRSTQFAEPLMNAQATSVFDPERATSYDFSIEQPIARGWRIQGSLFYREESNVIRRVGEERVNPATGMRIPEAVFPVFSSSLAGTHAGRRPPAHSAIGGQSQRLDWVHLVAHELSRSEHRGGIRRRFRSASHVERVRPAAPVLQAGGQRQAPHRQQLPHRRLLFWNARGDASGIGAQPGTASVVFAAGRARQQGVHVSAIATDAVRRSHEPARP
jgi:hypothetical protein